MNNKEDSSIDLEENEIREGIVKEFLPHILSQLIDQGLIDEDKSAQPEYLWTIVRENLFNYDVVSDPPVIFMFDEEFVEIAHHAIEVEKPSVAIVLIMVVVEHLLNRYYRDILARNDFSTKEITEIIRTSNIATKVGWLLKLSTGKELPNDLKERILKIAEIRNSIVHYKAVPVEMVDVDETDVGWRGIKKRLKQLDLSDVLSVIPDLQEALEEIYKSLDENYEIAKHMTQKMI
ncbi:hypothetical protein KFU94_35860 [Chloroflexi bacterium TSY]|nr:hypothetical protein [Chloroflexi bacterium TSY]